MLKSIGKFIKNNAGLEIFMSIVLLVSMTAIACKMDKVAENEIQKESETPIHRNGKTVVIDPGHGGTDPGKVGVNGAKEKDVNLAISMELKNILQKNGFEVILTREEDVQLSEGGKFSKLGDLNARCKIINDAYKANADTILISIHQNSFTKESVHGAQSFYYSHSPKSKMLAEQIQERLNKEINVDKPKKSKANDSYYMLINSDCPGIIVECGFLSNEEETIKLVSREYQKKLAEIINMGVKMYFDEE